MYSRLLPLLGLVMLVAWSRGQDSASTLTSMINQLNPGKPSRTLLPSETVTPTPEKETPCLMNDNRAGFCVPFYQCSANKTIIEDGRGLIDIRVREGLCPSYLETCCLEKDKKEPVPPPKTTDPPVGPTDPPKPPVGPTDPPVGPTDPPVNPTDPPVNPTDPPVGPTDPPVGPTDPPVGPTDPPVGPTVPSVGPTELTNTTDMSCGWRNAKGVGFRITGANDGETNFAEFPWMTAVLKAIPLQTIWADGHKVYVYVGGGSLIHPRVVLTAAHYVSGENDLRVRMGEWDTQTTKEPLPHQDRDVQEVVVHKDYNKDNLAYDVGLLFLTVPVDRAPNVGVACLPPAGQHVVGGTRCFASGWGKDSFGKEGRYQAILKKIELPVVAHDKCQDLLRKTRLGRRFILNASFMCAGGERNKDTCKGDGGSPLMCPIAFAQNRYVQNGIVAWGIGCGADGTPGVYVDVANVRPWIDDNVKAKGLDTTVYTAN